MGPSQDDSLPENPDNPEREEPPEDGEEPPEDGEDTTHVALKIHGNIASSNMPDAVGVMSRNHYLFYTGIGQCLASAYRYTGCSLRTEDIPYPEWARFRKPRAEQDTPLTHLERLLNKHIRKTSLATISLEEADKQILLKISTRRKKHALFEKILARNALRALGVPATKEDTFDITESIPTILEQLEDQAEHWEPKNLSYDQEELAKIEAKD